MRWLGIALGLTGLCVQAQTAAAQGRKTVSKPPVAVANTTGPWTLRAVKYTGSKRFSETQLEKVAALRLGSNVTAKDFEAARLRLAATGMFEYAAYEYKTLGNDADLTLQLRDAATTYQIRYEDLGRPDAELNAELAKRLPLFSERIPASPELFKTYAAALNEILQRPADQPAVRAFFTPESAAQPVILFRPNSSRSTVADVQFAGNKALSSEKLRAQTALSAIGTVWSEERFRDMLQLAIRPLYEEAGYVGVKFPEVKAAPFSSDEKRGMVVTVTVDEGEIFGFGPVLLRNSGLAAKKLTEEVGATLEDTFDIRKEQRLVKEVIDDLKRTGHLDAKAEARRTVDAGKKRVAVEIVATPGEQYRFGRLILKGLDVVTEPGIRKLWGMKPGAPFNASYPDYFLSQIREQRLMDNLGNTRAVTERDERELLVDVTLYFEGTPAKPKPRP